MPPRIGIYQNSKRLFRYAGAQTKLDIPFLPRERFITPSAWFEWLINSFSVRSSIGADQSRPPVWYSPHDIILTPDVRPKPSVSVVGWNQFEKWGGPGGRGQAAGIFACNPKPVLCGAGGWREKQPF